MQEYCSITKMVLGYRHRCIMICFGTTEGRAKQAGKYPCPILNAYRSRAICRLFIRFQKGVFLLVLRCCYCRAVSMESGSTSAEETARQEYCIYSESCCCWPTCHRCPAGNRPDRPPRSFPIPTRDLSGVQAYIHADRRPQKKNRGNNAAGT